jgi:hypothetical protein
MHKKNNMATKWCKCRFVINKSAKLDMPFLVLSEINFPFLLNLKSRKFAKTNRNYNKNDLI